MKFLKRLFHREAPASPPFVAPAVADPEVLEQLQKLSRASARTALRLEDLEKKLEGGFADLRSQLSAPKVADQPRPEELFDALDALDEACVNARALQPELAEGLERVARRVEEVTLKQAWVRVRPHGQPPDGRLFKVVGAVQTPDLADGLVARVVRAAITSRDGATVRQGEVITSRKDPS